MTTKTRKVSTIEHDKAPILNVLNELSTNGTDVRRMLDERAITAVLVKYIRGVDRRDVDIIRSAFHPDALIHKGSFEGGLAEFLEFFVANTIPQYHRTMHYIRNVALDVEGDTAYVEVYLEAVHMRSSEENTVIDWSGGRFIDRFERREGEWKLADLTYVLEWDDSQTSSSVVAWRGKFSEGITCDVDIPELASQGVH